MTSRIGRVVSTLTVSILLAAGLVAVGAAPADAASAQVDRWEGPDRYATSATTSAQSQPAGVPVAYVANGGLFPDALSGAPAAARGGGPVLLTGSEQLPGSVAAELGRLRPARIVVLGGTPSVGDAVVAELEALSGVAVERLEGPDRYATSAAVSAATFPAGVPVAFVASGETFPDALSGAPAAARLGGPVLLTRPDELPAAVADELARLRPARIVVLGGAPSVGLSVREQLSALAPALDGWEGADRYATSAAISAATFPGQVPVVFLASGETFPDAMSGGPAAARLGGPVLLTPAGWLPPVIAAELRRLKPARIVILGGTPSVSAAVAGQVTFLSSEVPAATGGTITRTTEVAAGSCLSSPDASHGICVGPAGDFWVYRGQVQLWNSGSANAAVRALRIRDDGNAVLYDWTGGVIWQSSTAGTGATELAIQNDGDLMLRTGTGAIVWSSMSSATAPTWRLPFASGQSWAAGAPHANSGGTLGARGALDFGPRAGADRRVLSIADGTVYRLQCAGGSYLGIQHANGWQSTYYHLVNYQEHLVGRFVPAGTYLGDVGRTVPCGGGATFDHVHLVIRRAGVPVSVEGMRFGGFTTRSAGTDYWGWWTNRAGQRVLTAPGGAACCLTAQ